MSLLLPSTDPNTSDDTCAYIHTMAYQPRSAAQAIVRIRCRRDRASGLSARLLTAQDADRERVQDFISARYRAVFAAHIEHFMPSLVAFEDDSGQLLAALGLRGADNQPLFVESYLDEPAEQAVGRALGMLVERKTLVEVGNLAVAQGAYGRQIVVAVTRLLSQLGYAQVIFAATQALRASVRRLGLSPIVLGPANPQRLGASAAQWGHYYATQPELLCGALAPGLAKLRQDGWL